MKFSLLSKTPDETAVCKIIYDISVDRAIYRIEEDKRKADYFLRILSNPLINPKNVTFRQDVFKDLISNDGLIDELKLIFTRYDKIKSDWEEMKLSSSHSGLSAQNELNRAFTSLKSTAVFPTTLSSFYSVILDTLKKYDIKSHALNSIKTYCEKLVESPSLSEIVRISQVFRSGDYDCFDYSMTVKTNDRLYPIYNEVFEVNEKKAKKSIFSFKSQSTADEIVSSISKTGNDPLSCSVELLSSALKHIDRMLAEITSELYEAFYGMSTELVFFEVGLKYIYAAKEQGISTCFPEILEDEKDYIKLVSLKELLLMSEGKGKTTVENDFMLETNQNGLIVKGMTDSGKTVYLRAIASAQLFAQSGLPILAKSGCVSIRHGFFSHFSSAEEEFLKGNAQGRFDQEAREISEIIDSFKPYSLLLLNETFQTTSYDEGTESIYNILKYMPKLNTKYVFVTHLTKLFDYMSGENVILAKTSDSPDDKYRILKT